MDLFLHKQALDTSTSSGRAMFGMVSVFAEFEADIIKERVNAGLARARAEGKRLGRPRVDAKTIEKVRAELSRGTGMLKTAKLLSVGVGTVQRIRNEMSLPSPQTEAGR